MNKERSTRYIPPKIEFSSEPELFFIRDSKYPVYKYIPPEVFIPQLKIFTSMIDFDSFDAVVCNLNGGEFPLELLEYYSQKQLNAYPVEYHPSGKVVTRIPKNLYGKKVLAIEDIFDSGKSKELMIADCPNLKLCVMSQKMDVPGQTDSGNVIPLFLTVNKWQAGAGMNIDFPGDQYFLPNSFRSYPGIVIRPSTEVLKSYSI